MKGTNVQKLTLSAMFLTLGLILPFLTGQIRQLGNMLLPMHIPILLCGLICGWKYGFVVGFITPILRSVLFGMPVMFPSAIAMAFELMTYGFIIGILYQHSPKKSVRNLYGCILVSVISGRVVLGITQLLLMGIETKNFTIKEFLYGAFIYAIPGILLQLIIIPAVILALRKTDMLSHKHK